MKFPYQWFLKDKFFIKGIPQHKSTVFSCFAGGGGSSMGYKLAGYDVIGCNEIDPKMMDCYIENLHPKYSFLEQIQILKNRTDLPKELYNLDILDGSPPCSSFSRVGVREKDWGKKKKFKEGQIKQVLDTLFFDFIDLVKKLQPKIVIAENVTGLLLYPAMNYKINYVNQIYKKFDNAGYYCHHWILDASKMGVPQVRKRVFFIAIRKNLKIYISNKISLFNLCPKLDLKFNENPIIFKNISDNLDVKIWDKTKEHLLWEKCKQGKYLSTVSLNKNHYFSHIKLNMLTVPTTIIANNGSNIWHPTIKRLLNIIELCKCGTFPLDYNFLNIKPKYIIGMSVPPVMMAQISYQIYLQWLSKIKT